MGADDDASARLGDTLHLRRRRHCSGTDQRPLAEGLRKACDALKRTGRVERDLDDGEAGIDQYLADGDDLRWLRGTHKAMDAYLRGAAYVNYIDPDLADWRRAYYGANADRLAKVKAAYDPGRLFRFPQAV